MRTHRSAIRLYLAGLAVAVASAFALAAQAAPSGAYGAGPGGCGPMMAGPAGHGPGPGPMGAGGGGPGAFGAGPAWAGPGMGMHLSGRMLDRVNATPEQRAQLRKIAQDAATELRAQHEAGRAMRQQMASLLAQPAIDAAAVEALRQQMTAHHDQVSKRRMQALIDASGVLSADQRRQIAEFAQQRREMWERHHRERQSLEGPKS